MHSPFLPQGASSDGGPATAGAATGAGPGADPGAAAGSCADSSDCPDGSSWSPGEGLGS